MLVALIMGFACGLPLLLTKSVLQAWMTEKGVDLTVIGLFALVGLPYSIKFLWSPLLDHIRLPFLGRRRGWLLIFQVLLTLSIAWLGFTDPGKNTLFVAIAAFLVTLFSASQDIVVDAYRREDLNDPELGLGSSLYVNGYRLGMLLASGGGLILADHIPYTLVYLIMAACMLPGIITTILTPEPELTGSPTTFIKAVYEPFVEYFSRRGAIWILAFILLYKIGDTMASEMTIPFYLNLGFTKTEIGAVVKLFGFWATIAGGLLGGVIMLRIGINRSLWYFGILQAVSTAGFVVLARAGHNITALTGVISFENLSSGMGTAAYVAFMASITNKKFTATQYALLSSLMAVPRVFVSSITGILAKHLGWTLFFIACVLIAIPGLLILRQLSSRKLENQV
ncbi:MAG: AmpG family muropeptide MFS transporter [Proteobacteria bacterium]|nr:AmpG family muropeptide MFS transporter [Pseudomonadota bacterium]MBU1711314.1 AmpG family muropeptide MFS transporter [Pseudomonadota bacterium]